MKNLIFISLFFSCKTLLANGSIDDLYRFSEDVRDVIVKSPGGHPMSQREFQLSSVQADQMKALSSMDDSMREHLDKNKNIDCDQDAVGAYQKELSSLQKRVDKRDFQIGAVVFLSDKKYEQNALGRFMSDDYINYMGQEYQNGNPKAWDIYSVSELTNKYKIANPGNNFDSLSFKQQEKVLNEFAESYLGKKIPSGLLMKEMAFQKMVNHSADWKSTLNDAKDRLSSEQKIHLVSKLGGYFGNLYNYDRRDNDKENAGIFIDTQSLLDSVKNGTPGGVCRDIALAQTQFLQELGFKNNYVVSYKMAGSRHATVISTDPESGKIIKFNYDETTENKKGSGTEALRQDTSMPDTGLGYRIYDTNGKSVTKVPSELAQMLKSSAGGDSDRDFNQRNFSLNRVGFSSPYVDGNLFTGKTSSGETLYGVAFYKNFAASENAKFGMGASMSKVEGDRGIVKMDQDILYLRANAEVSSPSLKLGPTATKAFFGSDTTMMMANTRQQFATGRKEEASKDLDVDVDMYAGVQNIYQSKDGKTAIDSKIYANFYPDWDHVAKAGKTVVALDSVVVKSGVSYGITEDAKALVDTAIIMRNYGTNIVAKAALEDSARGLRYAAGGAMPLTKDMPSFLPGGERRAFASIEKDSKNYVFSIEYERNFDNKSNAVMVKGGVKF